MFIFEPTEGFWTIKFLNILNIRERNKKTWGLPTALYQAHIKHEVSPRSRKSPSDLSWEEGHPRCFCISDAGYSWQVLGAWYLGNGFICVHVY